MLGVVKLKLYENTYSYTGINFRPEMLKNVNYGLQNKKQQWLFLLFAFTIIVKILHSLIKRLKLLP